MILKERPIKKLITALAILLPTSAVAQPDKDWWACQPVESVGLKWEDGKWNVKAFEPDPLFVLMSDGEGVLTQDSVAEVFGKDPGNIKCSKMSTGHVSCANASGDSLYFDPNTANGGYSYMFGASQQQTDKIKDAVSVSAFECIRD